MNKALASTVALFLLQPLPGLLAAADASDSSRGRKIDLIVVAEVSKRGEELAKSDANQPPTYTFYDGGYVEAGEPIAGEHPPGLELVADRVGQALDQAGFRHASAGGSSTYVIVYTWGLLRPENRRDIGVSRIDPNLKQRLLLVAPWHTVSDLEQEILTRRVTRISSSFFVDRPAWRDALDYAHDPRYFLIVTAFDSRTLSNSSTPAWRTTLSTLETSTTMVRAIPAMTAAGASYFGKDYNEPRYEHPVLGAAQAAGNSSAHLTPDVPPDELRPLIKKEHDRATGEFVQRDDEKDVW